jgi:hypothetical protein
MEKQISKFEAGQLAKAYADAMELTRSRTYRPDTTPSRVLGTYLHWAKATGVVLHNAAWEAEAERVVDELNEKRRAAWAKALRKAGVV